MGIWTSQGLARVLTEFRVFDVINTIHRDWLPHLLQGSVEVEEQTTHPEAKCQRLWGWGKGPPHPTPIGAHFNLPAAKLGNFRLPVFTVSMLLPLDSPNGQMAGWEGGASRRLPRAWGEGQRCQPPGPSPILFASKFLSNTFWGFPQPPTPDLSWKVWVPLFLPWEGLE